MASFLSVGGPDIEIGPEALHEHLNQVLDPLCQAARRLLLIPPDISRSHSRAGQIVAHLWDRYATRAQVDVLPAIGTHTAMSKDDCRRMFQEAIPFERVLHHKFRTDVQRLGELPGEYLGEQSGGAFAEPIEFSVSKHLFSGYDGIVSVGQVVPHEVVGMANYTKNILIGVGGKDAIDKTHFLGAVCGIEAIMGHIDTPVRRVLNEGYSRYLREQLPIVFILTVVEALPDRTVLRGLFCGDDDATFERAAELSRQVNITPLGRPLDRCVVYLDPDEYKSTWLGNKAIYRTRRAMADGGELIILAPGICTFGEDPQIDALIRRHGYTGTQRVLQAVRDDSKLAQNLAAAAHLIHGSSEGRFRVTYCPGSDISRDEWTSVGYQFRPFTDAIRDFDPARMKAGWQTARDGRPVFYIPNPGLGLWTDSG